MSQEGTKRRPAPRMRADLSYDRVLAGRPETPAPLATATTPVRQYELTRLGQVADQRDPLAQTEHSIALLSTHEPVRLILRRPTHQVIRDERADGPRTATEGQRLTSSITPPRESSRSSSTATVSAANNGNWRPGRAASLASRAISSLTRCIWRRSSAPYNWRTVAAIDTPPHVPRQTG